MKSKQKEGRGSLIPYPYRESIQSTLLCTELLCNNHYYSNNNVCGLSYVGG